MIYLTELSLGPFACKKSSDKNDVFDRIIPGENSDDCFFGVLVL
jgi:hypothetical protein